MLARRWGLELLEPAHATYSTVWFASRGDEQLVLKIGDAAARERESVALRLYDQGGAPVCRLREVDRDALVVEVRIYSSDGANFGYVDDVAVSVTGADLSGVEINFAPAPGALALLGVAGLAGSRRRRA